MKYIYQILLISLLVGMTSCEDWFDIHPKSETIREQFWNNEDDVLSAVLGCYRTMNDPAFMERLIAWGELRSDNVIGNTEMSDEVKDILILNLTPSHEYSKWNVFYEVINYCNTVIRYAPEVHKKDPNFTQEELNTYLAEAKGLRALCYFHLVRTFRDVPLITEPTVDDSHPFQVKQTSPDVLIDYLIDDLISVEKHAPIGWASLPYTKGRITRNAIHSIIADMCLWKGDYENCIKYCDLLLANKDVKMELENSNVYNQNIFIAGNSSESIFELQFNKRDVDNHVVNEMYGVAGGRQGKKIGQLIAFDFVKAQPVLLVPTDLRGKDAFFPSQSGASFPITKYIAYRVIDRKLGEAVQEGDYAFGSSDQNWIFYRLSDIYLMKAEALVERGRQDDFLEAFELVSLTYERANPDLGSGALDYSKYESRELMRNLIFDERQREFMFEGKRYFDLLRRINRENSTSNVVSTYLLRKYTSMKIDVSVSRSKLSEIDALYVPIHKDELKLNGLLNQNPFYMTNEGINKN